MNENNTFVYYLTLQNSNIFIDVSNKNSNQSIFKISAYNEQDLNDNPYQEVLAQSEGMVKVDTSSSQITFEPIYLRNFNDDSYDHKVTYFLYLSTQFKVMRYAKNCGKHLIEKAFNNPELITNKITFLFEGSQQLNYASRVAMTIPKLDPSKKYYGVVIAHIHLLTRGEGMVEPLRQSMTYYDEFIIVSGKAEVKINYWLTVIAIVAVFVLLVFFINDYIFGDIRRFKDVATDLRSIGTDDFQIMEILESDFKEEEPPQKKTVMKQKSKEQEIELQHQDDRKAPLDIDS